MKTIYTDNIRTKVWLKLKYKNPKLWLLELDRLEKEIVPKVIRKERRLLDQKWAEARQAGIFVYGMGMMEKKKISFAMNDVKNETDFVALFIDKDKTYNFVPVQLKEWAPKNIDPKQSLEKIYSNLITKYPNSKDLTVAIYICRDVKLKFSEIKLQGTQFAGVWIFGGCSEDKKRWFLLGDIQHDNPTYFEFDYPTK